MNCLKCGKAVVKKYGFKDLCNLCYTKSLNLSARGTAEMKKLKDELKQVKATLKTLRTTLSNHKLSLKSPDGPRYKALGNSMAVPVMRWLGERINKVNKEQA